MKTLKKVLAVMLAAGMMFGCSSNEEPKTEEPAAAKYAKVGLAVVSSSTETQNDSTIVTVGLDAEGKIAYCDIEVSQLKQGSDDVRTKTEKGADYGMLKASGIKKEWFEQAEFLEKYVVDNKMTPADVAAIETYAKDDHHDAVPAEGSDLAAGCTISIGDVKEAIAKACENAKACECDVIGTGYDTEIEEAQTDVTVFVVGAKDGKVVNSILDVIQIKFGAEDTRTKVEKQGDYGMVKASGIGKEWFEQAAAFEAFVVGMTADEIAAIETYEKDEHHNAVPAEGSDLAAGCTMNIGSFQTAAANAFKAAK